MSTTTLDLAIIGAGAAGLHTARRAMDRGVRFEVFDASPRIGDSWRERYRSLRLFTPRRWAELPGWIWISTPLITAGIMGRSVTGPGAEVAAFEDICALWLLVGVIGVFVRWINRRHARLHRG